MGGWLVFQLAVDLLIFFVLVFLIVKGVAKDKPEAKDIGLMLDEIKKATEENRKLASKIEIDLKEAGNLIAVQEAVRRKKATASIKRPEQLDLSEKPVSAEAEPLPPISVLSDRKRNVKTLYRQGVSKDGISERLSIPLPEVDLIVAMIGDEDK